MNEDAQIKLIKITLKFVKKMFGMTLKITLLMNTRVHAYTNILDLELE